MPALALLIVVALSAARVEFPILLLVATALLEAIFTPGAGSQLSVTKVVGALAFASFALNAVVARRRLYLDAGHVLVFGLLAIAMVSTLQAEHIPEAVTTTTRYASFVALFFVVSQFVGDHRFQARIAWVLSISSAIAGALASWELPLRPDSLRTTSERGSERRRVHPRDDPAVCLLAPTRARLAARSGRLDGRRHRRLRPC